MKQHPHTLCLISGPLASGTGDVFGSAQDAMDAARINWGCNSWVKLGTSWWSGTDQRIANGVEAVYVDAAPL
jgi:hypothetical protein